MTAGSEVGHLETEAGWTVEGAVEDETGDVREIELGDGLVEVAGEVETVDDASEAEFADIEFEALAYAAAYGLVQNGAGPVNKVEDARGHEVEVEVEEEVVGESVIELEYGAALQGEDAVPGWVESEFEFV